MQRIKATYRVTTPMFLGGAEHQAELRAPSIKGLLRYWWRALAWSRIQDVADLRRQESELFGSSDENIGQSKVLLRLTAPQKAPVVMKPREVLKDGATVVGEGARYLGYGVMEAFSSTKKGTKAGQLTRPCFPVRFDLSVELLMKPTISATQRKQIEESLIAVGLFGGLGSKSRKGYGSLSLQSLSCEDQGNGPPQELWKSPANIDELERAITTLLGTNDRQNQGNSNASTDPVPEWTAFSPRSRVVLVAPDEPSMSSLALLDRVGREMLRYRSWGKGGQVLGAQSEKNFRDDHDLMKQDSGERRAHPRRVVFGLPHNYGKQLADHVEPSGDYDRRASPLFIHIHALNGSSPVAVISFLPSRFLPGENPKLSVGDREVDLRADGLWEPIHSYLNRMLGTVTVPGNRKESFGQAKEVTHG